MPSHLGHGMNVPYLDRGPKAISEYHTITNLPFEVKPKIQFRYEGMNRPSSVSLPFFPADAAKDVRSPRASSTGFYNDDDDEFQQRGVAYARFLKEYERTLGPACFLDSERYTHSYKVPAVSASPRGPRSDREPMGVVALTNRIAADQKEFERRMKMIEDHMWQHKQEERELKRVEGDVVKKKRAVLRTMREFENSMSKKMLEEEKKLNESMEKTKKVVSESAHTKEERTKLRISKAHSDLQQTKDKLRKNKLVVTDAERQYRAKLTELELRKSQIQKMTDEFEGSLKRKENEAYHLAQELSNLAIQMNMESMKGRVADVEFRKQERVQARRYISEDRQQQNELDKKLSKSEGANRSSENRRRQASADLASKKSHLLERSREGDRRVTDNRNLVEGNIAAQKKLQEAAEAAELDKQRKERQRNVQAHVVRKQEILRRAQSERQATSQKRAKNWEKAFDQNHREFVLRRNKDLLRTFTRIVHRDNEMEHQLFQKCRQNEHGRKSLEQAAHKAEERLVKIRARNTGKIRQCISDVDKQEKDVEQKARRAKAEVVCAQNQRNTSEWMLRKFRGAAKETEHVQQELTRESKRLQKLGARNDTYLEQQAVPVM